MQNPCLRIEMERLFTAHLYVPLLHHTIASVEPSTTTSTAPERSRMRVEISLVRGAIHACG